MTARALCPRVRAGRRDGEWHVCLSHHGQRGDGRHESLPEALRLADEDLALMLRTAIHRCACGAAYTWTEWDDRPLVGVQDDGEGGQLEMRNCRCGSTMARARAMAQEAAE